MNVRRESAARTIAVAAAVAVICSLIVSTAVYVLRPYELAYSALDRNRAILAALGVVGPDDELATADIVDRFLALDRRVVDLQAAAYTSAVDASIYDFRKAIQQSENIIEIPQSDDVGGLGSRPRFMPVYLRDEAGASRRIALPIYASGMWSTIYGYVALEADLTTIAGITIYEHGETPGIGDRILAPAWLGSWRGKRLYDPDGVLRFRITADQQAAQPQYRVDSITGATVSASALGDAIRYWFSSHGYGRFLERLAEEAP
ncbi:MAG: NADH:ubiquinone reductase (Na(+)-transporting) subunit C [Gammaproteobacteria bacterium]|jgi:Na+-transporting NADH:ubiquinone oxidoreductase subunit C